MTFTRTFWIQSLERAIKAAANAAALVWTAGSIDAVDLEWSWFESVGSAALFAAGVSLLMSIGSTQVGDVHSPSLVPTPQPPPAEPAVAG